MFLNYHEIVQFKSLWNGKWQLGIFSTPFSDIPILINDDGAHLSFTTYMNLHDGYLPQKSPTVWIYIKSASKFSKQIKMCTKFTLYLHEKTVQIGRWI